MDCTKVIQWKALDYCPEEQLSHKGHALDAGYDLRFAEDVVIKPYRHYQITFEWVCPLDQWQGPEIPYTYCITTRVDIGEPAAWIYRRKYNIPTIKTGVILIQPDDVQYLSWGLVLPRSGTSKYDVHLGNTAGVIDIAYTGEVGIRAYTTDTFQCFRRGEALFQVIPTPQFGEVVFERVQEDNRTEQRGGFGSTGK